MPELIQRREDSGMSVIHSVVGIKDDFILTKKPRFLLALFILFNVWLIKINLEHQILVLTIGSKVFYPNVV
jgi:hypothetical protein